MNELTLTERDGEYVITSEAVAEGAGIQHASVLRLIDENSMDFEEFGQVRFEIRPGYNNSRVRVALLNEQQATLLMTFQRNTEQVRAFKKALVKAFFEMGKQQAPTGANLLALAVVEAQAMLTQKDEHIAELEPKAEAWSHLVSSSGSWSYLEVAHTLQNHKQIVIGQKRLVELLVSWGLLFRDAKGRPHAYQRTIEQGLFVEKLRTYIDTITGQTLQSSAPQVRITGKGIDMIYRRLTPGTEAVSA